MSVSTLGLDQGKPMQLTLADRRSGLYVIGKNGTGKSTLLLNLIVQDMQQGTGFCLLDPHGDLADWVLARVPRGSEERVILLDVGDTDYPFGLNLYTMADVTNPGVADRRLDQVLQVFRKLWEPEQWGPMVEAYLQACGITLLENPGYTMLEMPLLLSTEPEDAWLRERLTARLTNPVTRDFWRRWKTKLQTPMGRRDAANEAGAALRRIDSFRAKVTVHNIVGQEDTTIDMRAAMDGGYFVIVKMPVGPLGKDVTTLLGGVLVGQVLMAALSRIDIPERDRRQFHFYCDEYHRFATEDMASLLTEVRKFGVGTTVAHQFRDQLRDRYGTLNAGAVLQAGTKVVFGVSGMDGEELAKEFNREPPAPLVTGQRSKMAMVAHPAEHLVRRGSSDPSTAKMIGQTLISAYRILQEFDRRHRESEQEKLNQHYFGLMTGLCAPRSAEELTFWARFYQQSWSMDLFALPYRNVPALFSDYDHLNLSNAFRRVYEYFCREPQPHVYRSVSPRVYSATEKALQDAENILRQQRQTIWYGLSPALVLLVQGKESEAKQALISTRQAIYQLEHTCEMLTLQVTAERITAEACTRFDSLLITPREVELYGALLQAIKHDTKLSSTYQEHVHLASLNISEARKKEGGDLKAREENAIRQSFQPIINSFARGYEQLSPEQRGEYQALAQKGICRELRRRCLERGAWLKQHAQAEAVRQAEQEVGSILMYASDLIDIGHELARNPIYTESGQYEPIYDKPRPYADVQHEVANELTNQPNLTARCKLPSSEATIRVHWDTYPVTQSPAGIAAIRERCRKQYGRPRREVEAAIMRRQTPPPVATPPLGGLSNLPPPPTTPPPPPGKPKMPPRNRRPSW